MIFNAKLLTSSLLIGAAHATSTRGAHCARHGDLAINVVNAAARDYIGLEPAFEAFRDILGGDNNGNNAGPFEDGHRQINWDAPIVPFDMPGNFFASTVDRGLTVNANRPEFRVSNPADGSDHLFDSISPEAAEDFSTFSPQRLFAPLKDNKILVTFSVPGTKGHQRGTVDGFGAIFSDVDRDGKTLIIYYDVHGCEIHREAAKPFDKGLSFVGAHFEETPIYSVVIVNGDLPLIHTKPICNTIRCKLGYEKPKFDVVAMDDFLFSEPQAYYN